MSYRLLERPVLRGGVRLRGASPRLVAPITAAALVAALLAVTWSPPPPEIVLAALGDSKSTVQLTKLLPTTTTTRPHRRRSRAQPQPLHRHITGARPLRIMIVGDSVALTLGRGFELWARAHGGATVDNAARMYCPLGRGLPAQQGFAENFDMSYCDWTRRWPDQVASFDPDVVVVLFTIWETAPRRLPGSSAWSTPRRRRARPLAARRVRGRGRHARGARRADRLDDGTVRTARSRSRPVHRSGGSTTS